MAEVQCVYTALSNQPPVGEKKNNDDDDEEKH